MTNPIAKRLKKDWGYMIAENKHKDINTFTEAAKSPVHHLFNDHKYCGSWCDAKKALQEKKAYSHPQGWLSREVVDQEKIYHQLVGITDVYGSASYLEQSRHPFNTQTNEALNNSQASVTPKNKVFHTTKSFTYRHSITVGTHNWGFRKYWTKTYDKVGVKYGQLFVNHLERVEHRKERMRKRQRKPEIKRKRAHKQAATERALMYEERTEKQYESGIGLDIGHEAPINNKKRKANTNEDSGSNKAKKPCKWCKLLTHQTKKSKLCWYNKHNVAAREAEQKANKNDSEKNKEKDQSEDINNNADGVSDIEKNNTMEDHVCNEEENILLDGSNIIKNARDVVDI